MSPDLRHRPDLVTASGPPSYQKSTKPLVTDPMATRLASPKQVRLLNGIHKQNQLDAPKVEQNPRLAVQRPQKQSFRDVNHAFSAPETSNLTPETLPRPSPKARPAAGLGQQLSDFKTSPTRPAPNSSSYNKPAKSQLLQQPGRTVISRPSYESRPKKAKRSAHSIGHASQTRHRQGSSPSVTSPEGRRRTGGVRLGILSDDGGEGHHQRPERKARSRGRSALSQSPLISSDDELLGSFTTNSGLADHSATSGRPRRSAAAAASSSIAKLIANPFGIQRSTSKIIHTRPRKTSDSDVLEIMEAAAISSGQQQVSEAACDVDLSPFASPPAKKRKRHHSSSKNQRLTHLPYRSPSRFHSRVHNPSMPPDTINQTQSPHHVDFTDQELQRILICLETSFEDIEDENPIISSLTCQQKRERVRLLLEDKDLSDIAQQLDSTCLLLHRCLEDIEAFLEDVSSGRRPWSQKTLFHPTIKNGRHIMETLQPCPTRALLKDMTEVPVLRSHREQHKKVVYDTLSAESRWTGASGDVNAVVFAPDQDTFAVCSTAPTGEYNRPLNLLIGSYDGNRLRELPDHRVKSNEWFGSKYQSRTVAAAAFSRDSKRMFTASYDRTVKIWDVSCFTAEAKCIEEFSHRAEVDLVTTSKCHSLWATGSRCIDKSICIFQSENDNFEVLGTHNSPYASSKPQQKVYPTCLNWGSVGYSQSYLLSGFSANNENGESAYGQICIWDANSEKLLACAPDQQSIQDCAWHPTNPEIFVVAASKAANDQTPGLGSVVKLYELSTSPLVSTMTNYSTHIPSTPPRHTSVLEMRCSSKDANSVMFCPYDTSYVVGSYTDGRSYVWDMRSPKWPVHVLEHARPLQDLDETDSVDLYGVGFASFGASKSRFYTGSSDGVVLIWDITRPQGEACVGQLADIGAGIRSGSFSADHSRLVVGDLTGSITTFSVLPDPEQIKLGEIRFDRASSELPEEDAVDTTAADAARENLDSGEIILSNVWGQGAVQGPRYGEGKRKLTRVDAHISAPKGYRGKICDLPLLPEFQDLALRLKRFSTQDDRSRGHEQVEPPILPDDDERCIEERQERMDAQKLTLKLQKEMHVPVPLGGSEDSELDVEAEGVTDCSSDSDEKGDEMGSRGRDVTWSKHWDGAEATLHHEWPVNAARKFDKLHPGGRWNLTSRPAHQYRGIRKRSHTDIERDVSPQKKSRHS